MHSTNSVSRATRTRAAIAAYDQHVAEIDSAVDTGDWDRVNALEPRTETLMSAVGEAFAADTADRNDREAARRVRASAWLRDLVAGWEASL
jgi:hypothetical protein